MLEFQIISSKQTKVFKCENLFFTSDTHFSEQRTLELSQRPFASVEHMNKKLVENWNSQVSDNDIVIHLGDFGESNRIRSQLNGRIILLFGNYDRVDITINNQMRIFDTIYSDELSLIFKTGEYDWELVHEPENRVTDLFYLFGHIHKTQQVKPNGLNVGVDCHNFKLLSLDDVLFYKEAITKHYDNNVFGIF